MELIDLKVKDKVIKNMVAKNIFSKLSPQVIGQEIPAMGLCKRRLAPAL